MPKLSAVTAKAAPTTADELIITDKADSNNTKRIIANNLPLSAAAVSALAAKAALAGADFTGDVTTTGNMGVGTSSTSHKLEVNGGSANEPIHIVSTDAGSYVKFSDDTTSGNMRMGAIGNNLKFDVAGTEAMRIDSSGNMLVGKTSADFAIQGTTITSNGTVDCVRSGATCMNINRLTNDGRLIGFYQDGSLEGSISVSGTTVSYNGGHLARWSRMLDGSKPDTIKKGTVMSNLDEMIEWAYDETPEVLWAAGDGLPEGVSVGDVKVEGVEATYWGEMGEAIPEFAGDVKLGDVKTEAVKEVLWTETDGLPEGVSIGDVKTEYKPAGVEDNEQLNHTAISSVEGDKDVAGVFIAWDDDDEYSDYNLAMVGDVIIRIAEGVDVKRGDLLVSAGNGTAKPQDDDLIRSSTIAKVTSTVISCTYDDGSFCVPCVLK